MSTQLTPELMAELCARHLTAREAQEVASIIMAKPDAFATLVNQYRGKLIGDGAEVAAFVLALARKAQRGVAVS